MFDYRRVPVYLYGASPRSPWVSTCFNGLTWMKTGATPMTKRKPPWTPCHSLTPPVLAKLLSSTLYLFSAFTTTSTENQVDAKICQSPDGKSGNSSTSPRNHYKKTIQTWQVPAFLCPKTQQKCGPTSIGAEGSKTMRSSWSCEWHLQRMRLKPSKMGLSPTTNHHFSQCPSRGYSPWTQCLQLNQLPTFLQVVNVSECWKRKRGQCWSMLKSF